jgi:RNA polymerase-binding transcription factor DksA
MDKTAPVLSDSFIASQRKILLDGRSAICDAMDRIREEDRQMMLAALDQAGETEDHAQDLEIADNNRQNLEHLTQRRAAIDQDLARIADGTYGVADFMGDR